MKSSEVLEQFANAAKIPTPTLRRMIVNMRRIEEAHKVPANDL